MPIYEYSQNIFISLRIQLYTHFNVLLCVCKGVLLQISRQFGVMSIFSKDLSQSSNKKTAAHTLTAKRAGVIKT